MASIEIPDDILDQMKKNDDSVTLKGFLGRDPEIRNTKEKTFVVDHRQECRTSFLAPGAAMPEADSFGDELAEDVIPYGETHSEVIRPPREYAVMSLAVHDGPKTTWYNLRVFNIDPHHPKSRYREMFALRIARKGEFVEVTGRKRSWTSPDDGYTLNYIDVTEFSILRTKRR